MKAHKHSNNNNYGERIAVLETNSSNVITAINDLKNEMRLGFAQIDKKLDAVDKRFDNIEKRFDKLEARSWQILIMRVLSFGAVFTFIANLHNFFPHK